MQNNKRVLFIHHGIGIGGAPRSFAQLANKLGSEGVDIKVLYLKDSDAKGLLKDVEYNIVGLPLVYFNHSSRWYRWYEIHIVLLQFFSWFFTVFIVAPYWLKKIKPDVVYLNSSVLTDWLVVTKLMKIKNVLHVRESISRGYLGIRKNIIKMLLENFSDELIFLSQHNRKRLRSLKTNVSVIHNYVNESVEQYQFSKKIYDIIYVGGSGKIKGIEIIKSLLRKRGDLSFCLLGYYENNFLAEFNEFNNITIKGAVKNPLDYISQSKMLIFPAITPHFPRPVIEALGCGTVPIASNLDGMDEIITNGFDGLLFESGNILSLIETIDKIKSLNLDLLIRNGKLTFNKKFSHKNEDEILSLIMTDADNIVYAER